MKLFNTLSVLLLAIAAGASTAIKCHTGRTINGEGKLTETTCQEGVTQCVSGTGHYNGKSVVQYKCSPETDVAPEACMDHTTNLGQGVIVKGEACICTGNLCNSAHNSENKLKLEPIQLDIDRESDSVCYDGHCKKIVRGTASTRGISNVVLELDDITKAAGNSHEYFIEGSSEGKSLEEAKEYLRGSKIYTSKKSQVGVGVLIENYSKYILMFPTVDFASADNYAGKKVTKIGNVDPGKSALVILDNDYSNNPHNRGLYGTISWQISTNKNVKGTETRKATTDRLILGFEVPYEGDCTDRENSFSITMAEIKDKLNETTGEWIASHKSKNDYDLYHYPEYHNGNNHFKNWAHYQAKQDETLITSFRKEKQVYRYHVTGTMDGACMATLHVRFFDDLRGDPKEIAERMEADSNFAEHAARLDEDGVSLSNMGGEVKLIIYIGAAFGGLLCIVAIGIFVKGRLNKNNRDRDYS